MAELLVRVIDKPGADPNLVHSKAGDVIVACPDGWHWSEEERSNPEWRIISVNLVQSEIEALTQRGLDDKGKLVHRCKRHIDLDALPNPEKMRGERTEHITPINRGQIIAAVKARM